MTWNAAGLLWLGRELAFCNLLGANTVDVMAVNEVKILALSAPFAVAGYVTFCPTVQPGKKTRVLVLVRDTIASSPTPCQGSTSC
jgi:hypothetical protein